MKAGLLINPIAGMGGSVGLKGTDDPHKARGLGAVPVAQARTEIFLASLTEKVEFLTCPQVMGEYALKKFDFPYDVVLREEFGVRDDIPQTTREHTRRYCALLKERTDIILFAGGDGTAYDVFSTVGAHPILGIPCGVKMYSSVFAATPAHAADVLQMFLAGECELRPAEIMDVDEEAFRHNMLSTTLLGFATVPHVPEFISYSKSVTQVSDADDQKAIAEWVAETLSDGVFLLGPGTTVCAIAERLGLEKTLLGVDIYEKRGKTIRRLKADASEKDILEYELSQIIVSPIGRQGFIFGRGNQQISTRVLEGIPTDRILIVATRAKLRETEHLRIDVTEDINRRFDYVRVVIGYHEWAVRKVVG